jgi:Trypsin-co-occurring domain 1
VEGKIKLIVPGSPTNLSGTDRLGGETHSLRERIAEWFCEVEMPAEKLSQQLENIMTIVQTVSASLNDQVGQYSADQITIGLAITGEGSIGVATAGVEASIEVTFKRHA